MSFLIAISYRLLQVFQLFLVIRAIFSWLVPSYERHTNKVISFFYQVTDPVVEKTKTEITDKIQFFKKTSVDLTVLVVFLGIEIVKRLLMIFF